MGLIVMGIAASTPAWIANAQAVSTTTIQGTVYEANGQPGAGTLAVSWPAFTTANNQAVTAGRITVAIAPDGFMSVNLAPNLGAMPAGLYYTAIYDMSDGTTSTEYWVVPASAQASLGQVRAQVMPAAQAVQAVNKAYVDQSVAQLAQSLITVNGGTMSGPLYLSGDPTQSLQASDKHYVDATFAKAVPLSGGNMTGPLAAPGLNGVQSPVAGSSQTTLEAAMSAAGTNGAMEIPPSYTGTDGFTNPNGIYVRDLRQTGSQQFERSVTEFGAVCDGTTNDTNALQAAINYAQTHGVALTIPQGTCKTHTLTWHGESMGGLGKQVSALMGFPGQDVLATATDSANMLSNTRLHDLTIYVDQSVDVSCSAADERAAAGSCTGNRPLESNSILSPGGNGLNGTPGSGTAWAIGNCAIAMPAVTGLGGNGLRVAEIENLEIVATGVDPMTQYAGVHSTHTCGMYLAQWPQWSEFRNIDIRGLNTGIAMPALPGTIPSGLNADSNRWQNITIQAAHGFVAAAGSNNVLDNVVVMAGNSAATGEPPTGLVLDFEGNQQGWTVRNAVVLPSWNVVQPQLAVIASGGAVTAVTAGPEHGLGYDPYGTQVPLSFSGSCTAQATAHVNMDGAMGAISVTQGGTGCSGTTTASVNVAGTWDTAAPVNLISGQNMTFFAGNMLKGNGGYTVWNATGSQSFGTQLDGGGGNLEGGGTYPALVGNTQVGAAYPVDQFPGADFGAKLQACLSSVSAAYGGSCDARNFSGTLSMGSNLTISTANTTVLLPCATISTPNQLIVTTGTRNVSLRGCALRGASNASGSLGGTVFLYSGSAAVIQVGDPTYAADTLGFHMDNVVINTTAAANSNAQGLTAYRTQEMDLESLYFLGNSNQTGITLDGTGNYTGGTFFDNALNGFQTAVNAIGHKVSNPATTDWLNASTFVRLHIDCPTSGGSPIVGTYGINLQQGDGNTFTGGDVEGCNTALHLGPNAQNNTIIGLRNENSNNQVVADAGSMYNNWMTGGTMFTGQLTDNGTRNSFLDTFHRSFNGLNGDWYGSQKDATITNHYRLGTGAGNERGLLDRFQTDYGYRWTMGLTDAATGEQYYQILDELSNVNRLSIGQYNNGQGSTNNQTVINAAGTGAVVLNGSNNSGTGGVVFGSGGPSETTVATISNTGNAQFNGTLQVSGAATFISTPTVKNQADAEIDETLWAGATTSQKESFIYKDWSGNSQWYMVKDASNNWALNSATGGLDSFKAYQNTNSGDTYINASNPTGVVRINYETGAGTGFNIYGGGSNSLYASFTGTTSIKFPGLAAGSGHSCLQVDNSGYLSNTGSACGSGSGGGTVNTGTTGQIAYYTASGAVIGGLSVVPISAGGTGAPTAAAALSNLLPGVASDAANGVQVSGNVTAGQSVTAPNVAATQTLSVTSVNPPYWTTSTTFPVKPETATFTQYIHPPLAPAWGSVADYLTSSTMTVASPGFNRGNPAIGQGGWFASYLKDAHLSVNSAGQSYGNRLTTTHAGVGDHNTEYLYGYWYNGITAPSDEGGKITGRVGGEASTTYQGTVTTGGSQATTVAIACTTDCANPGDGRYLTKMTPVSSGYMTALTQASGATPGSMTIAGTTVTPSTAWGTLMSDVATPLGNPAGITYTPETFTVTVLNGVFNTTDLLCFSGNFHEQARATSVTAPSGGSQTITVGLRQPHASGTWLMQGGPCGTFVDFNANRVTASVVLHYPFDVIGATNSSTIVWNWFYVGVNGAYSLGNLDMTLTPVTSLTNASGTVTMTGGGYLAISAWALSQPLITISGATDTAFNGACTNFAYAVSTNTATCTQGSSIGHTAASATFAVGETPYGNTSFDLLAGAEVIDVQDEMKSPPTIDGSLTLEPNNVTWNAGDSVTQHHHYDATNFLESDSFQSYAPNPFMVAGVKMNLSGGGIVGAGAANLSNTGGAIKMLNLNPTTMYQGFGGVAYPIGGISFGGPAPWGFGLSMQYAPEFAGDGIFYGAPLTALGVSDPNYYYYWMRGKGPTNVDGFKFTPATEILELNMGGASWGNLCLYDFGTSSSGLVSGCQFTSNGVKNTAVTSAPLLGTASDGTMQKITLGTNLSLSGTVLNATTSAPASAPLIGSTSGGALQQVTLGSGLSMAGTVLTSTSAAPPASAPLLGSTSGSALQAITLGTNLSLSGTVLNATGGGGGLSPNTPAWLQYLGDGSDGAYAPTGTATVNHGDWYYSSLTIASGVILTTGTTTSYTAHVTGTCTINGTITANGNATGQATSGYGGGSGGAGGGGTAAGVAGSNSGLTIGNPFQYGGTAGTAGGGVGGVGSAMVDWNWHRLAATGTGNDGYYLSGANGGRGGSSGGLGGNGGGNIILICGQITGTGTIDVGGQVGGASTANNLGGGGGGGGGIAILSSASPVTTWPTINVAGGAGGTCGAYAGCGAGGAGGAGWSAEFQNW
jgi:hypothetical protein